MRAAERLTPIMSSLIAKSRTIVMGDVDLALAAERFEVSKVTNVGHICVAPDRVDAPPGRARLRGRSLGTPPVQVAGRARQTNGR